jgi:hypothetical protein
MAKYQDFHENICSPTIVALPCPCCHVLAILASLSCQVDLLGRFVQIDLSRLSCPVVLPQLSCRRYPI